MATPWTCPACSHTIRHEHDVDTAPRAGVIYRCHVCRLELMFYAGNQRLGISRMSASRQNPVPCPKCHRTDGVDDEEQSGSSARWFLCHNCGHRFSDRRAS